MVEMSHLFVSGIAISCGVLRRGEARHPGQQWLYKNNTRAVPACARFSFNSEKCHKRSSEMSGLESCAGWGSPSRLHQLAQLPSTTAGAAFHLSAGRDGTLRRGEQVTESLWAILTPPDIS